MSISMLLADNHRVVCDGLGFLLDSDIDIRVVGNAADGREAVQRARELKPDILVIDISMPELNGIEATREISRSLPSTQVIILSMFATHEHIFRALQAGAKGYLLKESAGTEVVEAMRVGHDGGRYLSQKIAGEVMDDYVRMRSQIGDVGPLSRLTPREREVLQLVVEGKSSAEIADILFLSPKTIDTYRSRMMRKLEIGDLPALVKFAIQHGLTPIE